MTKRLSQLAFALLSLAIPAASQTIHTFSFGPLDFNSGTAAFTQIDGNNPNCTIGYCGSVQLRGIGVWGENSYWGMEAPNGPYNCAGRPVCGWGFPNNGFLPNNTVSPNQNQITWDNPGCGPKVAGCTGHTDSTVPLQGSGSGVTLNVHATYVVIARCWRLCDNDSDDPLVYSTLSTGGTGTAVYVPQ